MAASSLHFTHCGPKSDLEENLLDYFVTESRQWAPSFSHKPSYEEKITSNVFILLGEATGCWQQRLQERFWETQSAKIIKPFVVFDSSVSHVALSVLTDFPPVAFHLLQTFRFNWTCSRINLLTFTCSNPSSKKMSAWSLLAGLWNWKLIINT